VRSGLAQRLASAARSLPAGVRLLHVEGYRPPALQARYFAENINATGRANRAVLAAAMTVAGFVNYPTEWWHWSYGDRYWALVSGAPAAIYGTLTRLADGEPGEAGRAGDHAVDPERTQ